MTAPTPLTLETPAEHPFAQFVRILGKGKRGARGLTREEAREAMGMLLDGKVEQTQLGAFLMLLRHKEESPEELAGFTEAVRQRVQAPPIAVDLDWPSYAGKKRHLPWFLLAAKCLAKNGVRILLHGGGAHTAGRLYTEQVLEQVQVPLCRDWASVASALDEHCIAFIPLQDWAPRLQHMIDLRNTLGCARPFTPWHGCSTRCGRGAACRVSSTPATRPYTAKPVGCWAIRRLWSRVTAVRSRSIRMPPATCTALPMAKTGMKNGRSCRPSAM